jgi:hypothetical protein
MASAPLQRVLVFRCGATSEMGAMCSKALMGKVIRSWEVRLVFGRVEENGK